MGMYLNPGKQAFARIADADFVDKSGIIRLMNERIGGGKSLVCVSRPRRFGKSYAAKMLAAYYDGSCDSSDLFDRLQIARTEEYRLHLNQYNVLCLDMTGFLSDAKKRQEPLWMVPQRIESAVQKDLAAAGIAVEASESLEETLLRYVESPEGRPFIFIIDEWDAMIREAKDNPKAQEAYLNLLRGWFKNTNFTPKVVAAAYMTGILPIKKDGSQSAISDFQEFTMLDPRQFAQYYGFTEEEIRALCEKRGASFTGMKQWYDGYTVGECSSIYNPYSVMQALESGRFRSFWKKTSAAETLMTYIDMDEEGLQDEIVRLLAGESVGVDTDSFQNDVETFAGKDDVLTLLIHLGYLTYEEVTEAGGEPEGERSVGLARIPNKEVREEFGKILRKARHKELVELVRKSDQLLSDTLAGNEEAVARAIQEVHDSSNASKFYNNARAIQEVQDFSRAPTFYNNEQSLRYTVKMAYLSCVDQYARVEELPSGHGIADVVFLPKRRSPLPAMVVELKWDKSAEGAISQIKEKNYINVLKNYGGEVLLVGVSYDSETKRHVCSIETCMVGNTQGLSLCVFRFVVYADVYGWYNKCRGVCFREDFLLWQMREIWLPSKRKERLGS